MESVVATMAVAVVTEHLVAVEDSRHSPLVPGCVYSSRFAVNVFGKHGSSPRIASAVLPHSVIVANCSE